MDRYFAETAILDEGAIRLRFGERASGHSLSRAEVLGLWASDDMFCAMFSQALAAAPIDAYFWETPVLSTATLDQPFECVLTPASSLAKPRADSRSFATQLGAAAYSEVIGFRNLSGDADLVVPCRTGSGVDYAHLAGFLRTATPGQSRATWALVAWTADRWLERNQPCWISTSGLGVAWLHIRLDPCPKYYAYAPYRRSG